MDQRAWDQRDRFRSRKIQRKRALRAQRTRRGYALAERDIVGEYSDRRRRSTNQTKRAGMLRVEQASRNACFYEPRRPDFWEVAGGFPARTGGGGACCWTLVVSGTPCGFGSFPFFFEKSGISFFRFMGILSQRSCGSAKGGTRTPTDCSTGS